MSESKKSSLTKKLNTQAKVTKVSSKKSNTNTSKSSKNNQKYKKKKAVTEKLSELTKSEITTDVQKKEPIVNENKIKEKNGVQIVPKDTIKKVEISKTKNYSEVELKKDEEILNVPKKEIKSVKNTKKKKTTVSNKKETPTEEIKSVPKETIKSISDSKLKEERETIENIEFKVVPKESIKSVTTEVKDSKSHKKIDNKTNAKLRKVKSETKSINEIETKTKTRKIKDSKKIELKPKYSKNQEHIEDIDFNNDSSDTELIKEKTKIILSNDEVSFENKNIVSKKKDKAKEKEKKEKIYNKNKEKLLKEKENKDLEKENAKDKKEEKHKEETIHIVETKEKEVKSEDKKEIVESTPITEEKIIKENFTSRLSKSIFDEVDEEEYKTTKKQARKKNIKRFIIFICILLFLAIIFVILYKYNEKFKEQIKVYDVFEIGQKVKLADDSTWYVIENSKSSEKNIVILKESIVDVNSDGMFNDADKIKFSSNGEYNPKEEGTIGHYLENTYIHSLKDKVSGIESIRLLTSKEYVKIRNKMNFGYEWTEGNFLANNNLKTWWINESNNGMIYVVTYKGSYNMVKPEQAYFIRPVITINKDNVIKND